MSSSSLTYPNPTNPAGSTGTALDDALIRDFRCGLVIPTPTEHTGVHSFSFHHEGRFLLTSQGDSTLRLYNCVNGTYSKSIRVPKADAGLVRFTHHVSAAVLASTQSEEWEKGLRYLSLYDNRDLRYFRGHTDVITSLEMCPFEDTFMTASLDKTVRLWDLRTYKCQGKLTTPDRPISVYDPEGLVLSVATSTFNGSAVKLYDRRRIEAGPFMTLDIDKLMTPFSATSAFTTSDSANADELDDDTPAPGSEIETMEQQGASTDTLGAMDLGSTSKTEEGRDERSQQRRTRTGQRTKLDQTAESVNAATHNPSALLEGSGLARKSMQAFERERERKAMQEPLTSTAVAEAGSSDREQSNTPVPTDSAAGSGDTTTKPSHLHIPNYVGFLNQSMGFSADGSKLFLSGVVRAPMVVQNEAGNSEVTWAYRGKTFLLDAFTGARIHEFSVPVMMPTTGSFDIAALPGGPTTRTPAQLPRCLAAMSPDGNYITVSTSLGCLRTFNATTGEHLITNVHKPAAAALHARGGFDDAWRNSSQAAIMCPIQNIAWNPVYSVLAASDPTQLALWIPKGHD